MVEFILFILLYLIPSGIDAVLFKRANKAVYKAFIPVYSTFVLLDVIGRPKWWTVLLYIPIVNYIIAIGMMVDIANCLGKTKFYQHVLMVVFGFLYLPYVLIIDKAEYLGTINDIPKRQKSWIREWGDAILFAIVAATFIRWATFEAYTIPTPSMEKTLLVGDFLFVSKLHYGPRTPKTPLQVPLTHQKIWGTDLSSYLDWIDLPQYRFPGFSDVERNDIVVFNYPKENHPVDLKTNYIKRCVAVPGDVVEVKKMVLHINGQAAEKPVDMQHSYILYAKKSLNVRAFLRLDITDIDQIGYLEDNMYLIHTSPEKIAKLKKYDFIDKIEINDNDNSVTYPNSSEFKWARDNFGPLKVPQEGITIKMTKENVIKYGEVIKDYEWNENVIINGDKITIDGTAISEYTFKQNYYFMMGDNRHNSADSRFWGFVPADHIVGKAVMIWMSYDTYDKNNKNFRWDKNVRWERLFNIIK